MKTYFHCQAHWEPIEGFPKVAECVPHPEGKKERDAAGGCPPRHALSFLFLPPQAVSLS